MSRIHENQSRGIKMPLWEMNSYCVDRFPFIEK